MTNTITPKTTTNYIQPAIKAAKSIAKAELGVTLAAVTALGAMFVLQLAGLRGAQVLMGGGIVGGMALAAYAGGAMLGLKSKKEPVEEVAAQLKAPDSDDEVHITIEDLQ